VSLLHFTAPHFSRSVCSTFGASQRLCAHRLDAVRKGDGTLVADYGYNDAARYNTVALANGLTARIDYDTLGRTTQVSSTVAGYAYGYEREASPEHSAGGGAGNRTYMQRLHKTGQPADVYQYDDLYQLTGVWYSANATETQSISSYAYRQVYTLDVLGNRLEVESAGASESYQPNDGQQLTDPMNRYAQVAAAALSYDARGNPVCAGRTARWATPRTCTRMSAKPP
jgi:hypothetical protein